MVLADLGERIEGADRACQDADRFTRPGHVGDVERKPSRVALQLLGEPLQPRRDAADPMQQHLALLGVSGGLAFAGPFVDHAQSRDRIGLGQRQPEREHRIVVGLGVAVSMQADRHLDADRAQSAVVQLDPTPQRARDHAQHGIVDRGAIDRLRRLSQGLQPDAGERDLAPVADLAVERRGGAGADELTAQVARQVRTPSRLVDGMLGRGLRGAHVRLRGVVPQQRPPVADRGGAVGQRMVDPPDERAMTVSQGHQVDAPQRSVPFEALLEQGRDAVTQPGGVDRLVVVVFDDVLVDGEVGIGHPAGCAVVAGRQIAG